MTDLLMFGLLMFGALLLFITLYFKIYLVAILSILLWLTMAITNTSGVMLTVLFIALCLVNTYIALILIMRT